MGVFGSAKALLTSLMYLFVSVLSVSCLVKEAVALTCTQEVWPFRRPFPQGKSHRFRKVLWVHASGNG